MLLTCFKHVKSTCNCALIKLFVCRGNAVYRCKSLQLSDWAVTNIVNFLLVEKLKCLQLLDGIVLIFSLLFHQVSLSQLEWFVLQRSLYCKDRQWNSLVHLAWVVVLSEICCNEGQTSTLWTKYCLNILLRFIFWQMDPK